MISSFFFYIRSSLSREIVLLNELFWSLASYSIALAASLSYVLVFEINSLIEAWGVYLLFSILSFLSPIILSPVKFQDYKTFLLRSFRRKDA
jgi:hypothetical protein